MKKFFSFVILFLVAHCVQLFGQQASCRAKLEVDAPDFSCSVTITPEMINYGSSNYDDLIVLNGIVGFGKHKVSLVAVKGTESDTCHTSVIVRDVTKPVLILHQNVVVDLGATGFVNLTSGMVNSGSFDQCGPVKFVLSPSFVDCNSANPTVVSVIAYDSTGNYSAGTISVFVENKINATTSLVCNDLVTVKVGPAGVVALDASDILDGGPYKCPSYYQLVLWENNVPRPKPEVKASDAGKMFLAAVKDPSTGNSCWGNLKVELSPCLSPDLCDTQSNCEPVSDCVGGHSAEDNIEWPCDIEADYRTVLDEKPTPDVLRKVLDLALSQVEPIPVNNECSQIATTYTDQRIPHANGVKIIRTWTALNWLTGKVVSYNQSIKLTKIVTDQCFICDTLPWNTPYTNCEGGHTDQDVVEWPADIVVHSSFASPNDLATNPEVNPKNVKPEINSECTTFSLGFEDEYSGVNDTTVTIERKWKIFDFGSLEVYTYIQNITMISDFSNNNRTVCIKTMNGNAVENVQLQDNVFTGNDVCTSFPFDSLQAVVAPSKEDDVAAGVDIEDASMLLDHILGIQFLNEFQLLAADVNLDGLVTSFDLVMILKLITGDLTSLDKSWRFFYLPVGENESSLPLFEQADVTIPYQSYFFKAIKLGDINDDYISSIGNNYQAAKLVMKDDVVNKGEIYKFKLTSDRDHYATALQVEFLKSPDLDVFFILSDLSLSGTESLTDAGDRYIYSWLASEQVAKSGGVFISKGSPIFNIKMSANKNSILSELLKLGSEAHNKLRSVKNNPTYLLSLDVEEKIVTASQETPLASFWMPVPNPATSEIYILNADNILQLDLIDATGRKIKTWKNVNEHLDIREINNGIYLLRAVQTDGSTSSKPLYIIR